ncbi:MAG: hypothetical protein IPH31_18685 [Lewinellaceae bacterium]|nr:hypothetical protein [Lewinellaceae bacterium]
MATLSLYRSAYQGSDLVWRNTRFDSRYAGSVTAGKEWAWDRRGKDRSFGLNLKLISTGGQLDTPLIWRPLRPKRDGIY